VELIHIKVKDQWSLIQEGWSSISDFYQSRFQITIELLLEKCDNEHNRYNL
jgi:hypothetical protein